MSEPAFPAPATVTEQYAIPPARPTPVIKDARPNLSGRMLSLDAYRGFIMLAMVSGGFGSALLRGDTEWGWLAHQLDHLKWEGCVAWDLIQPAFMFMVGVSMPFAFAKRTDRGESWGRQFGHVLKRCFLLCFIGFLMDSYSNSQPVVQFIRVLQQIAIGYFIAFLFLHLGWKGQLGGVILVLAAHSLAFWLIGGNGAWSYDNRDDNIGRQIDRWLDSQFDGWNHVTMFPLSKGFYVTFNALSAAGTILIGVVMGELLKGGLSAGMKFVLLVVIGTALYFAGLQWEAWGMPIVKRIWTASFALYAAGWTCWMMAFFYLVVDIMKQRWFGWPFMVVGVNSIFIYFCSGVLTGTVRNLLKPFTDFPFNDLGKWQPVALSVCVTFAMWLLCVFLYRHRVFIKV